MGRGINKAVIVGTLGKDPEIRYAQNGNAVVNISVATNESWKDRQTGEAQERTEWHRIVAWRRLGEICGEYLSKGQQVYVEGRIQTNTWEDKEGNKRYTTEIIANTVQFLGRRESSESARPRSTSPADYQGMPAQGPADDDIPF